MTSNKSSSSSLLSLMEEKKQQVRETMRVVCSPQSSNERRKECERFLDQTFREKFEENYELVLDILKGVGKNGVNGGGSSSEEEESIEVSVFVSKCVLQYLRRAKMETDKSSHSTNDNNNLLLRILFQSIVSNDLLSLRGKEINSVCEFAALGAAVASMKMVRSEEDVETLVESSAMHFRQNSAHAFVHYLKAFGESVHDKNVGAIRPERRKLIAEAASRACVFVCRALEEMYKKNKQEKLLAWPCMPKV